MAAEQTDTRDAEIAALRARVSELEDELTRRDAATNALVARSQEKLYWLERWQVDLDRLMAKPGAVPALEAVRSLRNAIRAVRIAARKLRGGR